MENIKYIVSFCGTIFVYLIGGVDMALESLILFMIIDYITGIIKATKKENLNSKTGIQGIKKKIGILALVVVVTCLDRLIGKTGLIRTPIIYGLIANEGLSICENLAQMKVPLTSIVAKKLEQLKEGYEENDEK